MKDIFIVYEDGVTGSFSKWFGSRGLSYSIDSAKVESLLSHMLPWCSFDKWLMCDAAIHIKGFGDITMETMVSDVLDKLGDGTWFVSIRPLQI